MMTNKKKKTFTPSKYQTGVFNFITNGEGNAVICAVAGSGKTTTIIKSLELIPSNKKVILLAFNKSIKLEIQEKVGMMGINNVDVNTSHGLGFQTIMNYFETKPVLDNLKYRKLFRAINGFAETKDKKLISHLTLSSESLEIIKSHFSINKKKVNDKNSFQKRIIKLANLGRLYLGTDEQTMSGISKMYNISLDSNEAQLASLLVDIGNEQLGVIDFTDMIYLPNVLNLKTLIYDFTFVDECQDLNTAQRELMLKTLGKNSRFIAVGDKNQAIYGFAGADSESFQKLLDLPNTISLPLSVSYRCAKNIIKEVKYIVPEIKAFSKNPKGEVIYEGSVEDIKDGDMVLCRMTYPLVKLCLQFIKKGVKATIMGGDIGKSLINMVKDVNKSKMSDVFSKFYHDLQITLKRIMKSNGGTESEGKETEEYMRAEEKIEVVEAIYEDGDTADDVCRKIAKIFDDSQKSGIILSTVHRAKGLESTNVFIIHPEKMPSPMAKLDWEIEQEENLKYVAYTRAISKLTLVTDFNAYGSIKEESQKDKVKTIKPSKHIGTIGDRHDLIGEIVEIKYIENYNSNVYSIEDKDGNIFEKWGDIPFYLLTNESKGLNVGSKVETNVEISKHGEYYGIKRNGIKKLIAIK